MGKYLKTNFETNFNNEIRFFAEEVRTKVQLEGEELMIKKEYSIGEIFKSAGFLIEKVRVL
jgi:hypothetical protein